MVVAPEVSSIDPDRLDRHQQPAHPGPADPPRQDGGRTARRRKLCAGRPDPQGLPGHGPAVPDPRLDPDHRHVVPLDQLPARRDRAGDHRHAAAGAAGAGRSPERCRPIASARRTRPTCSCSAAPTPAFPRPWRDRHPASAATARSRRRRRRQRSPAAWPPQSRSASKRSMAMSSRLLAAAAGCGDARLPAIPQPLPQAGSLDAGLGRGVANTMPPSRSSIRNLSTPPKARSPATTAQWRPLRPSAIARASEGHPTD